MRIATWNLNNRVGRKQFRPEAAEAACALGADVLVLTEYYPKQNHEKFTGDLSIAGWAHQLMSPDPTEISNRTLIASRVPIEVDDLPLPDFNRQTPANLVAARLVGSGLRILGIRVPYFEKKDQAELDESWKWLETAAGALKDSPALIIGDLNVKVGSAERGGDTFARILASGWSRAAPSGDGSYRMRSGKWTEIDHALASPKCRVKSASYCTTVGMFQLAGTNGLSDHAALIVECEPI